MAKLRLALSCWNYDRMRALADGRVQPHGIKLNFLDHIVEEIAHQLGQKPVPCACLH